jgi:MOB kinase activator 1
VETSAPVYCAKCLDWILDLLSDENFFPQEIGKPFPKDFDKKIKKIFQRLVRIYAHWYRSHVKDFEESGAVAHLNTCFRHLYFFCAEHKLIDEQDWAPLASELKIIVQA